MKITDPKLYYFKSSNGRRNYAYVFLGNNTYQLHHRWVMEQYLNRRLSRNEHIHHINGNGLDNRVENLILISNSEHGKLHRKLKPLNPKKQIPLKKFKKLLKNMNGMEIAKFLGIGKSSVYRRMEEYGITR